jgi:hypothetical protein
VTSFYVYPVQDKCVCTFVVQAGFDNEIYERNISPFLDEIQSTDYSDMKKLDPKLMGEQTGFYEHDVLIPTASITTILDNSKDIFSEMTSREQADTITVLKAIDGKRTILEIQERTNCSKETITESVAFLITKGYVQVSKLFPVLGDRDERFSAYLEVIGIPKKAYDIVDRVWKYCTGGFSVREISEKTRIQPANIMEVLRSLGKYVKWQHERGMKHDR